METARAFAQSLIRKRAPELSETHAIALGSVWDEVVHRVIEAMLQMDDPDAPLHINVRGELSLAIAQLIQYLTEQVVEKRIGSRHLQDIDPVAEATECLEGEGLATIQTTARNMYGWWRRRMDERWLPKSMKASERDANPPQPKPVAVKPVRDKHFISRWFIRDYWAEGSHATRWARNNGCWHRRTIPFGRWGHRKDLWDDRLEAWFSLLEGDGKRPLQMLLAVEPLNPKQQEALIAFMVVHILRSPAFVETLRTSLRTMLDDAAAQAGVPFETMAQASYATLFDNHELYRAYANPLFTSEWAVVRSVEPIFVLPDTFCARASIDGSLRIIVPLTPTHCFVTLPQTEETKRIVPFHLKADSHLARQISAVLLQASQTDFLSHSEFKIEEAVDEFVRLEGVLNAIADAIESPKLS